MPFRGLLVPTAWRSTLSERAIKSHTEYRIEEHLVRKIANGDRKAFQRFYQLYKTNVYNTALGYMQNKEAAEEVTQDVFLSIFQKAGSFQGKAKVGTWVYRITVNRALNQLDRQKRRPTADEVIAEHHRVDFDHPGVLLEKKENARYLFAAIDSLADKQKTAFILSYVQGLPQQQVADVMETSLKSVESLLQRAKTNLRKKLKDLGNFCIT